MVNDPSDVVSLMCVCIGMRSTMQIEKEQEKDASVEKRKGLDVAAGKQRGRCAAHTESRQRLGLFETVVVV
jgi:hypothetical protein